MKSTDIAKHDVAQLKISMSTVVGGIERNAKIETEILHNVV